MYEWTKDNQDYDYEAAWETTFERILPFCEDCRLVLAFNASITISKSHLKKLRDAIDKCLEDPDYEPEIDWVPEEKHTQGSCLSVRK